MVRLDAYCFVSLYSVTFFLLRLNNRVLLTHWKYACYQNHSLCEFARDCSCLVSHKHLSYFIVFYYDHISLSSFLPSRLECALGYSFTRSKLFWRFWNNPLPPPFLPCSASIHFRDSVILFGMYVSSRYLASRRNNRVIMYYVTYAIYMLPSLL